MNKQKIDFSCRASLRESLDQATRILLQNSKSLSNLGRDRAAQGKIRLALLELANLVRRRSRESLNEGTRAQLRTLLEDLGRDSFHVVRSLSDDRVVKALQLTPTGVKIRFKLAKFMNQRPDVIEQLKELSSAIPDIVKRLQLSGHRGRAGQFHVTQVSPKVLMSIYGRKIFTELAITKRPPSARHSMFVDFLDCVWILSTNSSETEADWSTPIKIAALQRETGSGAGAHLWARLEAGDFTRDLLRDLGIA